MTIPRIQPGEPGENRENALWDELRLAPNLRQAATLEPSRRRLLECFIGKNAMWNENKSWRVTRKCIGKETVILNP